MKPLDKMAETPSANDKQSEVRLRARAVSRGVAIGKIVCLHGTNRQFYRRDLDDFAIQPELHRLRKGINTAKLQLKRIVSRNKGRVSDAAPGIFDAHRMLLADSSLQASIENEIVEQKINAEWAIKLVMDNYVAKYKAISDEHLRHGYIDFEDVCERILTALGGGTQSKIPFAKDSIIAAKELKPSTLVELAGSEPGGVITENGGWTSHTFILARELNWPAVTGVKKIFPRLKTGDDVIVDGYNGQIILHPGRDTVQKYMASAARARHFNFDEAEIRSGPVKTLDGEEIRILANSDTPSAYKKAKRLGAQGIGLYRSEFLFNQFQGFPSENDQVEAYRTIAALAGDDGVRIRTFDLGAQQLFDQNANREKNPALGLRALRLGFAYKVHLRTQLRALLRASFQHRIDIILPMISGISEIREIKSLLQRERKNLLSKGKNVGAPSLGAMIEVPSAVLMIKELAEETDVLCLGTNDLIQYLLAVDRDNETVANWFRSLHPAVLRAIKSVLNTAHETGRSVIVCGEMAGSPYYVPILLGLGATELSMNVHSIVNVRRIISGIALEETRDLVKSLEHCRTVEEIEQLVHRHIGKNWAHLFPPDFLSGLEYQL